MSRIYDDTTRTEAKKRVFKEEKPKCSECGNRLYWRESVDGFVCKNWKCTRYWKRGKGPVLKYKEET